MLLPVTLTVAAIAAIINLWLALRVSRIRAAEGVSVGDGGHSLLGQRMRAHANFVENAPFVLILMALVELGSNWTVLLWATGLLFVLARIAHPLGMERPAPNALRAGGALVTWVVLGVLAASALLLAYEARPQHRGQMIDIPVPPAA